MKVLVVDDNLEVRKVLVEMLSLLGYEVDSTKGGLEAIKILESKSYDVVITDGEMPQMSGFELVRLIKARHPQIFIIGLSGSTEWNKFKDAGADLYFKKPVDFGKLHLAIEGHF